MKQRALSLVALVSTACVLHAATVVNDGTTLSGLTRMANSPYSSETTYLSLDTNGTLRATAQLDPLSDPVYTIWHAEALVPTGKVYTVSADFKPAATNDVLRPGGVAAWVDVSTKSGLVLEIVPGGVSTVFRLASADLVLEELSDDHLFFTNGVSLFDDPSPGIAYPTAGFKITNAATLEIALSTPTAQDQEALTNGATAHILARVYQLSGTNRVQVCSPIELLTDLPLPAAASHRFGYFAAYSGYPVRATNILIGHLDNLTVSGQVNKGNEPPTLSLTSPRAGDAFTAPANVTLAVQAQDTDGSVVRVDYYRNGTTLVASSTNAPFTASWNGLAAGSYSLTAIATDNGGATGVSAPITFDVISTPPQLAFSLTDGVLTLTWTQSGFTLQSVNALGDTWQNVTTSGQQYSEPATAAKKYFRLAK